MAHARMDDGPVLAVAGAPLPPQDRPGPPQRFKVAIPSTLDAVRDAVRDTVSRFVRRLSEEEAGTLELTLAEVLNNVVEHAYVGRRRGTVSLTVEMEARGLRCRVEDWGDAMPGEDAPDGALPTVELPLPDLPEGGFGWFLIRELTDELTYTRRGSKNTLEFLVPAGRG